MPELENAVCYNGNHEHLADANTIVCPQTQCYWIPGQEPADTERMNAHPEEER